METSYNITLPYESSYQITDQSLSTIIDSFNKYPKEQEHE